MASIEFPKEQSPEVSILKKIQYPKNYIFAVYLHDQTGAQLALLSNKRDKPLRVLPLKKGENFDQKFGYFAIGAPSKYPKNFKIHDFHIFGDGVCCLCSIQGMMFQSLAYEQGVTFHLRYMECHNMRVKEKFYIPGG